MKVQKLKFLLLICNFTFICKAYALNLDNLKIYFLKADYKSTILEGEKILASQGQPPDLDELYYILGLSYLKEGNLLRASDIFEIILKEFKDSAYKDDALLGLGDIYFLKQDFNGAQGCYKKIIETFPQTKLQAAVYYRLSQVGFKKDDSGLAKEYLGRLKNNFPLNLELRLNQDLYSLSSSGDFYYTVQVGSFQNSINAKNLMRKLMQKGYPAYIQEMDSQNKTVYRVRVGKFRSIQEARDLEKRLTQEGYPTKLYP